MCSFILCKNVYIHIDVYVLKFQKGYSWKYEQWQFLGSGTLNYTWDWEDWRETFIDYFITCSVWILNMRHVFLLWNKGGRMEGRKQGREGRKKDKVTENYPTPKQWASTLLQDTRLLKVTSLYSVVDQGLLRSLC